MFSLENKEKRSSSGIKKGERIYLRKTEKLFFYVFLQEGFVFPDSQWTGLAVPGQVSIGLDRPGQVLDRSGQGWTGSDRYRIVVRKQKARSIT